MKRLLCILLAALLATPAASAQSQPQVDRARQLIENERAAEAAGLLRPLAQEERVTAEVLLLLSTAEFMLGNDEAGQEALERSLDLDPEFREAWLTRAALDMAEGRLGQALEAMKKAAELDPGASDNDLNIGAVYILKGEIGQANRHFNRYLAANRSSSEAYYLVATNYALATRWDLATQHLEAAVTLDELSRRRARTDPNFGPMGDYQPFQELLARDAYEVPAGAHVRRVTFDEAYDGGRGKLLNAVLNALQFSGQNFDPTVEVTEDWALIWSDLRIRVGNSADGRGALQFSAPAARMTPEAWKTRTETLLNEIAEQLALMSMRRQ